MKVYKLTDANDRTYGDTQWGENVTHEAPGEGKPCSEGWIHCYSDPLLAIMFNPIHGDFNSPHLWEAEAEGRQLDDHGVKLGVQRLTTIRRLELPQVTLAQRIRFGILCAKTLCHDEKWRAWADGWLRGIDRSQKTARVMARVMAERVAEAAEAKAEARAAAKVAAWATAVAEAWAATAAEKAAWAAANATAAEKAAWAAAWAAAEAAEAADAAAVAAEVAQPIDLAALAAQAVREETR